MSYISYSIIRMDQLASERTERLAEALVQFQQADQAFADANKLIAEYIGAHQDLRVVLVDHDGLRPGLRTNAQLQKLRAECEQALARRSESLQVWSELKMAAEKQRA